YIVIRYVVRDGDKACLQILGIVEAKELASRELCDGFSGLRAERIACGQKGHGGQPQGRSKLADAVEHLLTVVTFVLGIGASTAEAAVLGTGVLATTLRCFVGDGRARTRTTAPADTRRR